MNKFNKKFIISFLNMLIILSCINMVFADTTITVPSSVRETLVNITRILLLVGTAVCIGKIIHIGILFVTSTAMEKSQAKQALLPWIIGTIVCFGAATIGSAIIEIFTKSSLPNNVLDY